MLAPDGRCKTLDAEADGYVRAEVCGLFVLQVPDEERTEESGLGRQRPAGPGSDMQEINGHSAGGRQALAGRFT